MTNDVRPRILGGQLLRRERALNDRECDGQLSFDEHAVIELGGDEWAGPDPFATCMARLDELNRSDELNGAS